MIKNLARFLNTVNDNVMYFVMNDINNTRMHSSRMRTARLRIVTGCWGGGDGGPVRCDQLTYPMMHLVSPPLCSMTE